MGAVTQKDQMYRIGPSPVGVRAQVTDDEYGLQLSVTVLVKGVTGGAGEYLYRGDFDSIEAAKLFASQWVGSTEDWQAELEKYQDPYMDLRGVV